MAWTSLTHAQPTKDLGVTVTVVPKVLTPNDTQCSTVSVQQRHQIVGACVHATRLMHGNLVRLIYCIVGKRNGLKSKIRGESCMAADPSGHSSAGIADSSPARCMDVCLLQLLRVVRLNSLRRADPSSRGVLPSMYVCQ